MRPMQGITQVGGGVNSSPPTCGACDYFMMTLRPFLMNTPFWGFSVFTPCRVYHASECDLGAIGESTSFGRSSTMLANHVHPDNASYFALVPTGTWSVAGEGVISSFHQEIKVSSLRA